ncbi:SusD/RagB family nutrient-binding outer membrane lipoprotein [Hymenobacter sp. BT683]|uniref:SusD/RagB family nutrient-binding outer membrane lipoprotein n=1 Tax=Hymenobacter jeongseonensis TaxID=2791027 RepID=A0ABS0IIS1_9BACT|nr:SusD/RagB family nutrient-binding outer membrane lipoprotein [Hymenobacter jeongseonensis]MBF9238241.1 SusD/RagB family nutrient-binding outer membrane lipoprotein [Hymenobacter jeongseonensis]
MKSIFRVLIAAALATGATGCEKALDINDNPNQPIAVEPNAILASALAVTANNYNGGATNYNSYSSFAAGFWGKSGTVSGFSEERTYSYSTNYYQGLFNSTYDNLNDYNLIEQKAATFPNHAAIARIMKVYNFQLLVDQYGDIPYTQALLGIASTNPKYDKAEDIYKDFVVQLKKAVVDIDAAKDATAVGTEDIVFRGNMTDWKRFANSLRLRVLLRQAEVPSLQAYVRTEMTALQAEVDGFLRTDAVAQPGYGPNSNQQNPFYNRYGFAVGLTRTTSEYSFVMPTNYIIQQYEANSDPRITQLYALGKRTVGGTATPAYVGTTLGEANPPTFTAANEVVGSRFLINGTFLRGANQGTVLMLLSEVLFSKAEAETRQLFVATDAAAKQDFLDGIKASFMHTFRSATAAPVSIANATATTPGIPQYEAYIAANTNNGLVNWEASTTTVRLGTETTNTNLNPTTPLTTPRTVTQQEKIIYQKYLASNTVASTEAWADYRRTALPKFPPSLQSASTRADKLPTRLFYPQTEVSTNQSNIPAGQTQYTKVFWDVLD